MPDWTVVLETLVVSLGGTGAVAFLAKALTTQLLDKDLERFKADLAHSNEAALERLRADFARESLEHNVRFSKLHDRQATIVADVYANLDALHLAFRRWASFIQVGQDAMVKNREATAEAFQRFVDHYHPNGIWLDRATCNAINEIIATFNRCFGNLVYDLNEEGYPKDLKQWKEANEAVNNVIPEARSLLEQRFRQMLGVPGT